MQINKVQNYNPSFGIKISPDIIKAADDLYVKHNNSQEQFNKFYRKAKYMEENYGFNEYTLEINSRKINGKRAKGIFAVKDDSSKPILIVAKDSITKLLERFNHISEYELNNKLL